MKTKLSFICTSVFGIGFIPFASGTWGSLFAVIAYYLLVNYVSFTVLLFLIALTTVITVLASNIIIPNNTSDPKHIVLDEVVGMWITCLFITDTTQILWFALAFILFRILDVTKIPPINLLEKLHGGTGIVADDIGAGLVGGLILLLTTVTQLV